MSPKSWEDITDATNALIAWFNSQDIPPRDAAFICALTTAALVNTGTSSKQEALQLLTKLIEQTHDRHAE